MSAIDRYVSEIAETLHARGATERILGECRDHLLDAAADRGVAEAVRAFRPA